MTSRTIIRWVLAALLAALLATPTAGQVGSGERRIGASDDPTVASTLISQDAFPADASAIGAVVATSGTFADALAGSALAGTVRPILFTDPAPALVRPEVMTEIARAVGPAQGCEALGPAAFEVAILGGTAAVSADAQTAIEAAGYCVARFAGASREQTAIAIAEALVLGERPLAQGPTDERGGRVLIARRDNFADAATGGAFAAFSGLPLLVTPTDLLHPDVEQFLSQVGFDEAVILGGTAAIDEATAAAIGAHVDTVTRVAGPTRDGTAVAIAEQLWPAGINTVTVVNGYTDLAFVYAIAAGPLSALETAPQVYTQADQLTPLSIEYLASIDQTPAFAEGGRGVTQILSGPVSQIAYAPGEGFQGSVTVSSDVPIVATVSENFVSYTGYLTSEPITATRSITSTATIVTDADPLVDQVGPMIFGPDQRTLYAPTETDPPRVIAIDSVTGETTTLVTGSAGEQIFNAVPSPDGTQIAYDSFDPQNGGSVTTQYFSGTGPTLINFQVDGQSTFLGSHAPWTVDGSVVVNTTQPVVAIVDPVSGDHVVLREGAFQGAGNPRADQVAMNTAEGDVVVTTTEGMSLGTIAGAGQTLPIFSGDGTTLLTSTGDDAVLCPTTGMFSLEVCDLFSMPDGFFGSASITADAAIITALTDPSVQPSGFVVRNAASDQATVTTTYVAPDGTFVFGPALPNYCPPSSSLFLPIIVCNN